MALPEGFQTYMKDLLGPDFDKFEEAMSKKPSVSVKLNRRKNTDPSILGYDGLTPVPWCRSGYYLPERPKFTLNPLLHAGVFYVQEGASMIYETILERIVPMAFDTGAPLRVLDLCAAPGGKTTSMINALPDGSVVVANEFVPQRAAVLKENLIKWGYPDIFITNSPTDKFAQLPDTFDIVGVDAPCSGEGMMRKEEVAVSQWGLGLVAQCAELQREILRNACTTLKPGGFLIYSTCTFNREEDEKNLQWLVEEMEMVPVDLGLAEEFNLAPGFFEEGETEYPALRFMPHISRGEGLFAAVLRKEPGECACAPAPRRAKSFEELLNSKVKVICNGIPRTQTKGRDQVPTSEGALAVDFDSASFECVDLDLQQALSFLRHEALRFDNDISRGFVVVKYKGFPLGFVKNIGNRANNLYPQAWKIRNL